MLNYHSYHHEAFYQNDYSYYIIILRLDVYSGFENIQKIFDYIFEKEIAV